MGDVIGHEFHGNQWTAGKAFEVHHETWKDDVRPTDVFLRTPNAAKVARAEQVRTSSESARRRLQALGIDTRQINIVATDQMPPARPGGSLRAEGVLGSTDNWSPRIAMNVNEKYWGSRAAMQQENFKAGIHSSKDSDHVALHEIGHALHQYEPAHFGGFRQSIDTDAEYAARVAKDGGVARGVSRYASSSPHEFVAEVFAAGISGRQFGSDVKALYAKFKGPYPEQVFRS